MKHITIHITALFLISTLLLSCGKVDVGDSPRQTEGLTGVSVQILGESQVFSPTRKGPYQDGDIIEIKIPSPIESPVDLSKMKLIVNLENNCQVVPKLPGTVDLTTPYEFRVSTAIGEIKTYTLTINLVSPVATFSKRWFKNGAQLGYTWSSWISSLGIAGDYLVLYDGVENYESSRIRVYDAQTGDAVREVMPPHTYISQVKADDAGHMVAARKNFSGAGFMLYYYENVNSVSELILNYTADAGCPANVGHRFSLVGNLKEGKAYVYATAGNTYEGGQGGEYYYWEFNDGVVKSVIPEKVDFPLVTGYWDTADVQRTSTAADADIYLSYLQYSSTDGDLHMLGSRCYRFAPDLINLVELNRKNFDYKLLGFRVFTLGNHQFMAILTQPFAGDSGISLKVFDVTDPARFAEVTPDDEEYNEFMIFESEKFSAYNINMWGDVTVKVEGDKAYIYGAIISNDMARAGVMMYQMNYYPQQ